jgi:hypothetical protein
MRFIVLTRDERRYRHLEWLELQAVHRFGELPDRGRGESEDKFLRRADLLDTRAFHDGSGQVAFLALDPAGLPLAARITFKEGDEQEPYTGDGGRIRFAFVLRVRSLPSGRLQCWKGR